MCSFLDLTNQIFLYYPLLYRKTQVEFWKMNFWKFFAELVFADGLFWKKIVVPILADLNKIQKN